MKKNILGLYISVASYKQAIEQVVGLAIKKMPAYVCFANVHMLVEARQDKAFSQVVNGATFTFADGKPLAFAMQKLYGIKQERVAGMDFMPSILEKCQEQQLAVFFYGSTDLILAEINTTIQQRFPDLQVAGMISPPFRPLTEAEQQADIQQINASGAHMVLVSLGCPKQENWMFTHSKKINAVLLGVGGAFPVFAGLQSRAPEWWQKMSLEWLYRLFQEPKRLGGRYFKTNTIFIALLLQALLNKKN